MRRCGWSVWSFEKCESVIVVCEYKGSVVDVYGGEKRRVSVVCEEEREEERGESGGL